MSRPLDRRPQARRGVAAVEAAVALPVCLLFMLGVFEYGRYVMVRNVLENAAREGARYAAVHTADKQTSDVQAVVTGFLANQQVQLQNFAIQVYATDSSGNTLSGTTWNNTPFLDAIGVQIDGDYQPIVPKFLLLPNTVHISVVAVVNCEAD